MSKVSLREIKNGDDSPWLSETLDSLGSME